MKSDGINSKLLGPYNLDTQNVDFAKVSDTPRSHDSIEALSANNVDDAIQFAKLKLAFPWLNIQAFLIFAGKLNDQRVWEQVFANMPPDEMWQVNFGRHNTRSLDSFAGAISMANSGLFMESTQLCFIALLCGSENFKTYLDNVLAYRTRSKFIRSARILAETLEFTAPASDSLVLENRIRSAFSILMNDMGKPTTAIYEALEENDVFGRCPFKNGTRLLYIQFNAWLESLPKGFLYYLMESK